MDNSLHQSDLGELRISNRRKDRINAGMLAALLIALLVILRTLGMERTVVVPPNIQKTFWLSAETGSKEYLDQMAAFVAWLILDVDPSTVDWKKDLLLDFMKPDDHGAMKTKLELAAKRLKAMNASTSFLPQQLAVNEKELSVVLRGRLRHQINGEDTRKETKAYLAQFSFAGGRIHLNEFKEFNNVNANQLAGPQGVGTTGAATAGGAVQH